MIYIMICHVRKYFGTLSRDAQVLAEYGTFVLHSPYQNIVNMRSLRETELYFDHLCTICFDGPTSHEVFAPALTTSTTFPHYTQYTNMNHNSKIKARTNFKIKFFTQKSIYIYTEYQVYILFFRKSIIPMTMETRCSKVIFPNYSKKKPAEDTLVPPLWGTRGKNVHFSRSICSRCCTRRNLRFHVENSQHTDQKQLTRR